MYARDVAMTWIRFLLVVAAGLALVAGASCGWDTNPSYCCIDPTVCARPGGSPGPVPCTDPERPYCDEEHRLCIPDPLASDCDGPEDCTNPERPVCFNRTCVECEDSAAQCSPAEPVCDDGTHMCSGCEDNDQCTPFAETPWCLTSSGSCVACLDSPDCPSSAPVCDDNSCRSCRSDSECASDVCDEESGACIDEANAIYLSPTGQASGTCTRATPCNSFALGLQQVTGSRNVIKAAPGTYSGQVVIDGLAVTILADGATVQPTVIGQDAMTISTSAEATIEGLAITSASGNGVGVRCTNSTLRLRRSTIYLNVGGGVAISGCEFSLVNNVVAQNGGISSTIGGVRLSDISTVGMHEFAFNTVAGNDGGTNIVTGVQCVIVTTPLALTSSIVYGNEVAGTGTQVGGGGDCTWSYSDIGPDTVAGTGNINMDPDFIDAANRDYHLQASSPARDAADPSATAARDIDADARPEGAGFDMGADEVTP